MSQHTSDVVVIGGGNAALCAALAAREHGVTVTVLEAATEALRGGNSRFTGGAVRMVFDTVEDLQAIYSDLSEEEKRSAEFGTYTTEQYYDDMGRLTQYRTNPDLCETLITQSYDAYMWVKQKGVKYIPSFGRQAYKVGGKFKFFGGLAVQISGGGEGLIEALFRAARREEVAVHYRTRAVGLIQDAKGAVSGVRASCQGRSEEFRCKAIVIASGGFESNVEWRTRYLGRGWDLAKVRGTRYNRGEGIEMALAVGAMPYGQWSGCHAVSWDLNAPEFGDLDIGDAFSRHSYPYSLMINAEGKRFVDEGADLQTYTYAKYGAAVLAQPGQFAWQVWDAKTVHLQREVYRGRRVTKVKADTLEELARKLDGVNAERFLATVREFNSAARTNAEFNPAVKDGLATIGLELPKSNWALPIDRPPFEGYATTCGITFTFGGLRVNTGAEVLDTEERPIPGLYAAGELVGGLFYFNYPTGAGLTSGTVFGRIAGNGAGRRARGG
ncbi:MAG: FAD-dependent tricarballylate dehydrogenase TcuA [Candidatus Lambdaproteobacteria bacterium]|nr:FAD-dependent tricarballylate dehydrogenase TcuA [Candidatus Lambdaproteobacteria bacterium]